MAATESPKCRWGLLCWTNFKPDRVAQRTCCFKLARKTLIVAWNLQIRSVTKPWQRVCASCECWFRGWMDRKMLWI